jgi:predicted membrane channel-forming protein YqfA (hemolysin III family)
MTKSIKSIKSPNFLAKNLVLLIISGAVVFFVFFSIAPSNPLIVGLFIFSLFCFLLFLLSTIWFLVSYRGQQRVWYLKTEEFAVIYRKSLFVSLFISLSLFLKYVGQLNWLTGGVLAALLVISYVFMVRFEKN